MTTEILALTPPAPTVSGLCHAIPEQRKERKLRTRSAWGEVTTDVADPPHAHDRLEEMLSITAHELRTPLASGMLAVYLAIHRSDCLLAEVAARDDDLTAGFTRLQDTLVQAAESLERLDRFVGDLADVARARAVGLDLRLARCDLAAIVRSAVEEQRRIVPGRTIRLWMPVRPVAPVLADADRVRQVLTNYLTNALRYAPADRPIDVRLRRRKRWVWVAVQDEGPGVPRDRRRRIWERFRRADGTHAAAGDGAGAGRGLGLGLGLGLHICKTIVERHHGRIGLRSAAGGGSIFWFALPLTGADDGAQPRVRDARLAADACGDVTDDVVA